MLEPLAPVLLILVIAAAHTLYYRAVRKAVTQQVIAIEDFTRETGVSGGSASTGPLLELFSDGAVLNGVTTRLATVSSERRAGSMRHAVEHVVPEVVERDLVVEGDHVFRAALKVGGNLVLRGNPVFDSTVIINGTLHSDGDATFRGGVLVKENANFSGSLTLGSADRKAWLVARTVRVCGELHLNGGVRTSAGIHIPGPA